MSMTHEPCRRTFRGMIAAKRQKLSRANECAAASPAPAPLIPVGRNRVDSQMLVLLLAPFIMFEDGGDKLHQLFKMSKQERIMVERRMPRGQWGEIYQRYPHIFIDEQWHRTSGVYRDERQHWLRADYCSLRPDDYCSLRPE